MTQEMYFPQFSQLAELTRLCVWVDIPPGVRSNGYPTAEQRPQLQPRRWDTDGYGFLRHPWAHPFLSLTRTTRPVWTLTGTLTGRATTSPIT